MDRATCLPERFARQARQSSQGRWITTIFLMWVNAISIAIGMPGRALCAALLTAKWQNFLSTWKFMTAFPRPSGKIMNPSMKIAGRSEEHTSELQSLMRISYAVFCLTKQHYQHTNIVTQLQT